LGSPVRVLAQSVAVGVLSLALAPVCAAAAFAHDDTIDLAVSGDGGGRVWAVATWAGDRHPVDEPVAATLLATSGAGQQVGPLPMSPIPGRTGVLTADRLLPPGEWTVVTESAVPAIGRGQAVLRVGAAAGTSPGRSASPPPGPAQREVTEAYGGESRVPNWALDVAALGALVAVAALAVLLGRQLRDRRSA
jgi:hypothetical protein